MFTSDELLKLVNDYLDNMPYERKPKSLYEPVRYVLKIGGKRIRPVLMLLAYNLYKDAPENILSSAIALEIYHNYTLLHDDLMDNAPMRRGKPTVHKRWDANTAILSGDSMLVLAFEKMAQCCPDKLKPVIDLFTETALEIGEGQQYDMEFETRSNVTEDEYIEMIRLKTSVLLACALKIGAILADAPDEDAENLYRFGEQIGLAFQLQDDYLDVYGDPKVFGKATGGDILSNKKTYMLINALAKADDNLRKELEQWLAVEGEETTGMERTDAQNAKIRAVTDIYNKVGIDRMAQEKINYFFEESKKYLAAVKVPEEKKMMLREYTAKMMRRNK